MKKEMVSFIILKPDVGIRMKREAMCLKLLKEGIHAQENVRKNVKYLVLLFMIITSSPFSFLNHLSF